MKYSVKGRADIKKGVQENHNFQLTNSDEN
jgi:hypothetical protein